MQFAYSVNLVISEVIDSTCSLARKLKLTKLHIEDVVITHYLKILLENISPKNNYLITFSKPPFQYVVLFTLIFVLSYKLNMWLH